VKTKTPAFESNVAIPDGLTSPYSSLTSAERWALAKSEALRIAEEHGVPCFPAGGEQSRECFHLYGLACGLRSRCNPFGLAPAGYYDDAGVLKAVRYPVPPATHNTNTNATNGGSK